MPTTFVKGDLFEDGTDAPLARSSKTALAFAGDCSGAMDRGVAVAFKKRWPALAEAYAARAAGGKMQLGDVFAWPAPGDDRVVVYVLGIHQGDKKPTVRSLTRALETMIARAEADEVARIALPRLASAKGGLDPVRVKRVLTEVGDKTAVALVVFEQFVRKRADDK